MVLQYQEWLQRFRFELTAAQLQGWINGPAKTRLENDAAVLFRAWGALDPQGPLFPILQATKVIEDQLRGQPQGVIDQVLTPQAARREARGEALPGQGEVLVDPRAEVPEQRVEPREEGPEHREPGPAPVDNQGQINNQGQPPVDPANNNQGLPGNNNQGPPNNNQGPPNNNQGPPLNNQAPAQPGIMADEQVPGGGAPNLGGGNPQDGAGVPGGGNNAAQNGDGAQAPAAPAAPVYQVRWMDGAPGPFSPSGAESARSYLRRFKMYCQIQNILNDVQECARRLGIFLRDSAQVWLDNKQFANFADLEAQFLHYF